MLRRYEWGVSHRELNSFKTHLHGSGSDKYNAARAKETGKKDNLTTQEENKMNEVIEEVKQEQSIQTISSYHESEYTDRNNLTNIKD